jgi:AraC-like DNA-binding protein
MKPKLLKISLQPEQSFNTRLDIVPYFFNEWHFHPEVELVYILKGSGTQFIGDSIQHFKSGDMILVGSELPHLWRCDEQYFQKNSKLTAESIVLHFLPNCFGENFLSIPENISIIKLLEKAKQGLFIAGKTKQSVGQKMRELLEAKGTERIIILLQILNMISYSKDLKPISAKNYVFIYSQKESERLNNIYQYILKNFYNEIKLETLAALAHMKPHSFCRFFKSRTKKTLSRFLLEVRVSHACKLLSETDTSISEVCYDSGFNNFSNFNRHFKEITKITPSEFRKKHL